LLFDATGLIYFLIGFHAIHMIRALRQGNVILSHPLYILFHVVALASVIFVAVRFFRLFPKAQRPRSGPPNRRRATSSTRCSTSFGSGSPS
jgi:fumarate reductase subunit C